MSHPRKKTTLGCTRIFQMLCQGFIKVASVLAVQINNLDNPSLSLPPSSVMKKTHPLIRLQNYRIQCLLSLMLFLKKKNTRLQKQLIFPFDDLLSFFNNFQLFHIFCTFHICLIGNGCFDYTSLNVYLCYSLAITQSIKGK